MAISLGKSEPLTSLSVNKTMPEDTGRIVVDPLTHSDEQGGEPYFHDQIIWCGDIPDSKEQMNVWRQRGGSAGARGQEGPHEKALL